VFEYVVTPSATVAIELKFIPSVERSILNPASLLELSAQARSISDEEAAPAKRLSGAAGIVGGGGSVVSFAMLLNAESPAALYARTRY